MPWSGGVYTRSNGTYTGATVWQQDAGAGIDIEADRHDLHDQDIADGITACLNRDGQNEMQANLPMNGFQVTSLGAGTSDDDAINKSQADSSYIRTDGTSTVGADINMNWNTFFALGDGSADTDSATLRQVRGFAVEWAFVSASGSSAPSVIAQSGGVSVQNVSSSKTRVTFTGSAPNKNAQSFMAMPCIGVRTSLPTASDPSGERTNNSVVVTQEDWQTGNPATQGEFYIFRTRA